MFKIVIICAVVALAILAIVTIVLVVMNWSDKLYSPILSLLLAGAVTTFITVLLLLKAETIESSFGTLVVINNDDRLPPYIQPNPSKEFNNKLSEYRLMASPKVIHNGQEIVRFEPPLNSKDEATFYGELLQYRITQEIVDMHQEKQGISMGLSGVLSNTYRPIKLTEIDERMLIVFEPELSKNRFATTDFAGKNAWDLTRWKLPKGTNLGLRRIPSSPETGVEKHVVTLQKSFYFTIEITITSSFGTGVGAIPNGLEIAPERAANCRTSMFVVSVVSEFERVTAGNWRTEELKNWAKWLSEELKRRLSDQPPITSGGKPLKSTGDFIVTHGSITKIPA